ncbi:phosphodiesterase/alkaline phosphatase D-like protein [Saccharomonospora amisosensis]|uniref:Phosphodiesterase/alkaline phosphatase D-like protein n=1 Tax=Saccharomonospora amisosensis TaxID=1128677 RepID=A0A7X5ZPB8_9PSEU|nr:phosphodiesterase/alkaline phosphatase D-like protein [Saccharomonospora amisosensis]
MRRYGTLLGRELGIAELLSFAKRNKIRNMVWLTADVHFTSAHHYDPSLASFTDFDPFWEFVSGPLNAAVQVAGHGNTSPSACGWSSRSSHRRPK